MTYGRDVKLNYKRGKVDELHPIVVLLKELRVNAGMSRADVEGRFGVSQHVQAVMESGKTVPTVDKVDHLLACFGFRLVVVAEHDKAPRTGRQISAVLRDIAEQLDRKTAEGILDLEIEDIRDFDL